MVARLKISDCRFQIGAVLVAALAALPLRAESIDRVLAVVAGQIVTLSEVRGFTELGLYSPGNAADPLRGVLTQMIDRELVLDEVDRYAPAEPTPDAIDREVAGVRARFSTSEFDQVMARAGFDQKALRDILRQNLRILAYENQRFSAADPRREQLIRDWIAGLRRRGDVIDLYLTGR
jgi:hypothetical protein